MRITRHVQLKATLRWPVVVLFAGVMSAAPILAVAAEMRSEVLVYYANETAPEAREAANYDTVIGWLRTGDHAKHASIANSLMRDRGVFAAAVDVETDVLRNEIPRLQNGPQTIIFTNRLVRQGKCFEWRHGWASFRELGFPVPQDDNYILAANPLSRSDTLRDVLTFVAKEFPPLRHEFLFITKSHGSSRKAVTPRLAVRAEETNREELLRVAADQVGEEQLPDWAGRLGISKDDYFSIFADAGRRLQMNFSLIYSEACNAYTEDVRPDRLPDNVGGLLLIQRDSKYINLLYGDILKRMQPSDRLADVLPRNLPSKFIMISRNLASPLSPTTWSVPLWVYFTPLALWIVWIALQWEPWSKKKTRTTSPACLHTLAAEIESPLDSKPENHPLSQSQGELR